MSLCVYCGHPTFGAGELCGHHSAVDEGDWAAGNRLMCDFFHRGVLSRGLHEPDDSPFELLVGARDGTARRSAMD